LRNGLRLLRIAGLVISQCGAELHNGINHPAAPLQDDGGNKIAKHAPEFYCNGIDSLPEHTCMGQTPLLADALMNRMTMANQFPASLANRLLDDALAQDVRILGLSGLQGSGKSTLAGQLVSAAAERGLRALAVSLDDVYLDLPEREALARDVHPLLITRGPPGTHDVALACTLLDALRTGAPMDVPHFDKLTDRRGHSMTVKAMDLVIFEGWCVGVPPESEAALFPPLNPLERDEDPSGHWRRWCNQALARDYPTLWQRLERLVFLQPPGFEIVAEWRWQQQQALQAASPSSPQMTRRELDRFIQHYERISRQALRTLPTLADDIVRLDASRRVI